MRGQAIYALSGFAKTQGQLSSTASTKLAELVSASEGATLLAAIVSATNMLQNMSEKPPLLVRTLQDATVDPDRDVRHELISGLARYPEAYPTELRSRIFDLMKTVPADWVETIELIDMAIYYMDIASDRLLVADLLSALMTQDGNAPTLKTFDSAIYKIASLGNEMLGWFATKWLLDGALEVRAQVHDLFPPLDKSAYDFSLASFSLSAPEIRYLARKIFGYMIFSHGPATSLLWSCLAFLDETNREKLESEIAGFWLRNFPGDLELFDALVTTHPQKGLEMSVVQMRQHIEAYEKSLNSLRPNPALRPSASERRVQAEIAHDSNRDIIRNARKQSIFASIMAKKTILYGRASISYFHASPSAEPVRQVVPLINHETSTAMPRMDALYPARFNYMLRVFRAERRPK
ncbi:hypothetical protein AB9F36_06525 [Rhizobium leguminosarum]|uniref:hypothetical protein n=1 Tax=Rhizobium leguminosarum TaxID=384 RepID=UPI003F9A6F76